jgi:predicted HicB family RNase H-like nuclease
MKKKETLNFRVPAEFKQRLVEEAKKQRRSLTNYLETTFMEVWASQEKEPRKKKPDQKRAPE